MQGKEIWRSILFVWCIRDINLEVNDLPKLMQENPTISIHVIIADDLTITLSKRE